MKVNQNWGNCLVYFLEILCEVWNQSSYSMFCVMPSSLFSGIKTGKNHIFQSFQLYLKPTTNKHKEESQNFVISHTIFFIWSLTHFRVMETLPTVAMEALLDLLLIDLKIMLKFSQKQNLRKPFDNRISNTTSRNRRWDKNGLEKEIRV